MIRFPHRYHASLTPFGTAPMIDRTELEARPSHEQGRKQRESAASARDHKVFNFMPLQRALG